MSPEPKGERGNFFAVDLDQFHRVCDRGSVDEAHAYLILACGTGPDNATTSWSAQAGRAYSGHAWKRCRLFLDRLIEGGFVAKLASGRRPRYLLVAPQLQKELSNLERETVDLVASGQQPRDQREMQAANRAAAKGWLSREADRYVGVKSPARRLTWLPKGLVTGVAGQRPLLFRLSRAGEVDAFRLLVDLYAAHDLPEEGGVPRNLIWKEYDKTRVASVGPFDVLRFKRQGLWASYDGLTKRYHRDVSEEEKRAGKGWAAHLFRLVELLDAVGALEWVAMLVERPDADARLIHPLGVERAGRFVPDCLEWTLAQWARQAAIALLDRRTGRDGADVLDTKHGDADFVVPVESFASMVQVIGVPRLRFRPKTARTAQWLSELHQLAEDYAGEYERVIETYSPRRLGKASGSAAG